MFAKAQRNQEIVVARCPLARDRGITVDMPLAEAKAIGSEQGRDAASLRTLAHDPTTDNEILKRLAWVCDQFSPYVSIEEAEHPECLLLDITGCADLFHGEEHLARQLQQHVEQRGLHARMAIAGTVGLAWAVAHSLSGSQRIAIVSPEDEQDTIKKLPIHALRLPSAVIVKLKRLGIHTIKQVLDLPRESLPSRFGPELIRRLDQARGLLDETVAPERRPEPVDAIWESELPLRDENGIDLIITGLLQTILDKLRSRGGGIQHIVCCLTDASRESERLTLELLRPTTDLDHVLALLRLQWERITFREGITRIQVECQHFALIPSQPQSLLGDDAHHESARHFEQLIECLSSRLGREAVLRPQLVAEAQPERSYGFVPCLELRTSTTTPQDESGNKRHPARPLWIKATPHPVDALSAVPAGPPYWFRWQAREYVIAHSWGPERITAGWWHGQHVRRDYYVVEADCGRRFWLYRDLSDGCWSLHAEFD